MLVQRIYRAGSVEFGRSWHALPYVAVFVGVSGLTVSVGVLVSLFTYL